MVENNKKVKKLKKFYIKLLFKVRTLDIKPILEEYLKDCKKIAIMGIGNTMKGDDGFGVLLIENLVKHYKNKYNLDLNNEVNNIRDKIILLNCGVVPENFTDVLKQEKPDKILIIDAALMGKSPGTLNIVNSEDISEIGFSTHSLPMSVIVKYLSYYIDTEILIIGIEPEQIDFGKSLSKKIYEKNLKFTEMLINLLDSFLKMKIMRNN
ncbi:hydrogenase maturation peptidase HycI [Methanothermococcus okinawensis]|uniref:Hydrogenase maturation protease HycI n=1 Tax=Methanothermococcus okinawensis (strain DSM 14208 / JCM 11175 / IH1) TaxID=647113 RepID=F8AJJ0_METOI|nr:hydrogenase maturation protease HycI [Methanothermococcus okinawensis IH1]